MDGYMSLKIIPNWINGCDALPLGGKYLDKFDPHTGALQSRLADSGSDDVNFAISAAKASYSRWSKLSPVKRGQVLSAIADELKNNQKKLAECIRVETGKPPQDAEGEMRASILQAEFFAGEGMRLYGRTLTSFLEGKSTNLIRVPCGVVASIIPANTPMANICWKIFPALICGNTVVLKASEDAPELALIFANLTKVAGLPDGVLNVVQGSGAVAGEALVRSEEVDVISFTGSSLVGKRIAEISSSRLIKVSLEFGGKNSFIVCNDADIGRAAQWAMLSAFSNAGQRCAAAST
jgi:aldehyde dehydrogenase (NAD+)